MISFSDFVLMNLLLLGGTLLDVLIIPVLSLFRTPTMYDESRLLQLPYASGETRFVAQGYNGTFSHADSFALDFYMAVGSNILATHSGVVTFVEDSNTGACGFNCCCPNNYIEVESGADENNITIYSAYLHIEQGGACVQVGQTVQQGDVIAKSGNVGFSTAPHLHFESIIRQNGETVTPVFSDVAGDGIPTEFGFFTSANSVGTNFCDGNN